MTANTYAEYAAEALDRARLHFVAGLISTADFLSLVEMAEAFLI